MQRSRRYFALLRYSRHAIVATCRCGPAGRRQSRACRADSLPPPPPPAACPQVSLTSRDTRHVPSARHVPGHSSRPKCSSRPLTPVTPPHSARHVHNTRHDPSRPISSARDEGNRNLSRGWGGCRTARGCDSGASKEPAGAPATKGGRGAATLVPKAARYHGPRLAISV